MFRGRLVVFLSGILMMVNLSSCGTRTRRQLGMCFRNLLQPNVNQVRSCLAPGGRWGTCTTVSECATLGGQSAVGYCPERRQLCCLVTTTCGGIVHANNTYVRMHPSGAGRGVGGAGEEESTFEGQGTCVVNLYKVDDTICQFRLDFRHLELSPPQDGRCVKDSLVLNGQNQESVVPPLCGTNTGQHVYLEVSSIRGPVTMRLVTQGNFRRRLDVHVAQIPCSSTAKAPSGCLQYHTGLRGSLRSFNFPSQGLSSEGYTNRLNYTICLRKESNHCSVTYEAKPASFHMASLQVEDGQSGIGIEDCPNDYILLGGIRRCGHRLDSIDNRMLFGAEPTVTDSSPGPAIIQVVTDDSDVGSGFKLHYRQNPCTTS